jgi:LPXTG-motif cell wall-anchored protein
MGVLLHYSGGAWSVVPPPSVSSAWRLNSVYFTSSGEGWAAGVDDANVLSVLLHYSGGAWSRVNPPSVNMNKRLNSVYFTSPDEGWVVGSDYSNVIGVLLHYSTVTPPSTGANANMIAILALLSFSSGALLVKRRKIPVNSEKYG